MTCLFGCKCKDQMDADRRGRHLNEADIYKRLAILEHMFKESKPYKRAECVVLKEIEEHKSKWGEI